MKLSQILLILYSFQAVWVVKETVIFRGTIETLAMNIAKQYANNKATNIQALDSNLIIEL